MKQESPVKPVLRLTGECQILEVCNLAWQKHRVIGNGKNY